MYEAYYRLNEKPFAMTPDPAFLFLGSKHMAGLTMLRYGLINRAGITVLTGAIGAGKTTLIRQLLNEITKDTTVGLISNTHESFGSLMQWVSVAFGLASRSKSKAALYDQFTKYLIAEYGAGRRAVLIVDEAQNLDDKTLEELRLLTNINADKDQLLQLVLVGQPELRNRLRRGKLVQFVQRIGVDYHLCPLTVDETHRYIDFRITVAGGESGLFDPLACRFIHYQCGGIPRLINAVCDTAMVYGFATNEAVIRLELVYSMISERITSGLLAAAGVIASEDSQSQLIERVEENLRRAKDEFEAEAVPATTVEVGQSTQRVMESK